MLCLHLKVSKDAHKKCSIQEGATKSCGFLALVTVFLNVLWLGKQADLVTSWSLSESMLLV